MHHSGCQEGKMTPRLTEVCCPKCGESVEVFVRKVAPLGDPIEICVRGYELTLRKQEADLVLMEIK